MARQAVAGGHVREAVSRRFANAADLQEGLSCAEEERDVKTMERARKRRSDMLDVALTRRLIVVGPVGLDDVLA